MWFSNLLGNNSTQRGSSGAGDENYNSSETLGIYKDLSYQECQDLYKYWPLGKRIISALPTFAMSAPRTFTFGELPEDLVIRYEDTLLNCNADKIVKQAVIYARIYGLASIYIASNDIEESKPLEYKDATKHWVLNALDPLSMGGSIVFDNNPLSPTFQKPISTTIFGKEVHPKRIFTIMNDVPLFLKFNNSSFSFSGTSTFQNMTLVIRAVNRTLVALQRAATKAGSIVRTTKEVAHNSGISYRALAKNLEMIRNMENDGIAAIAAGEELTLFDIDNIQAIDAISNQLNSYLLMGVSDTPGAILLDKNLSFGLADGSEDMKSLLISVDTFRENMLRPLYNFVDEIVLAKAFSQEWLGEFIKEYPSEFRNLGLNEVFELIRQEFKWEFGNIYPPNAVEEEDIATKKLDNITKLKDLGATREDLETLLNSMKLYNVDDFTLEEISNDLNNESEDINDDSNNEDSSNSEESKDGNSNSPNSQEANIKDKGGKDD